MPDCKYCGDEIEWVQSDEGRWVAYDPEGDRHRCPQRPRGKPSKPEPVQPLLIRPAQPALPDLADLVQALNRNTAELKAMRQVLEQWLELPGKITG